MIANATGGPVCAELLDLDVREIEAVREHVDAAVRALRMGSPAGDYAAAESAREAVAAARRAGAVGLLVGGAPELTALMAVACLGNGVRVCVQNGLGTRRIDGLLAQLVRLY